MDAPPWIIAGLTTAVATLFAVLRGQIAGQLADARKDLADARVAHAAEMAAARKELADTRVAHAAEQAASRKEVADERKERLAYVERKLEDSEQREADQAAMIADIADLARAQARGALREEQMVPPAPTRQSAPGVPPRRLR